MSKISIVEGDIIEIIAGDDLSYAKKDIINSGANVIQTGKEKGVSHGNNQPAPFIQFDTQIFMIVEFEPLANFDGEFGFDWLKTDDSDNILKVQGNDISNLEYVFDDSKLEYISTSTVATIKDKIKKEYKKVPLKLPYYAQWLSILQVNQEIKLNMICKPVITGEDITKEELSFKKNDFYVVTVDGQTNENIKYKPDGKPKEITIKCIKPAEEMNLTPVDKDGKEIGKIIAINNTEIFRLPIRVVCVVKDTPNKEIEILQLISDFKVDKIEEYINKNSLNQALINATVEIDSKYRITFDENLWNGTFYDKANNWFTDKITTNAFSYIDDNGEDVIDVKRQHILEKFLAEYRGKFETDGKKFRGILLFITNIKKNPADFEGGVSKTMPVDFRETIIYSTNLSNKSTYSHEISHALGLEHFFWRDLEYKQNLNNNKNAIENNKLAISSREKNIKINQDNIKIYSDNIKEYEAYHKNHSNYYKENPLIAKFVAEQKKGIVNAEKNIIELKKEIIKVEKIIKQQKDNLGVYKANKYKFKEGATLNIMDYSSKTNNYSQWQWKIMQNDVKRFYGTVLKNL